MIRSQLVSLENVMLGHSVHSALFRIDALVPQLVEEAALALRPVAVPGGTGGRFYCLAE